MLTRFVLITVFVTCILGCESQTSFGDSEGAPSVLTETGGAVSKADCPAGGVEIEVGVDIDLDGNLDKDEVSDTHIICNGVDGDDADVAALTNLIEDQQDKLDDLQATIDALQAQVETNTGKVGLTTEQTDAIAANTGKVGLTTEQADAIAANTAKVGLTTEQADAIAANTAKVGLTTEQTDAIAANTGKAGITTEQADAIAANTAKVGATPEQAEAILANTAKVGVTTEQADAIAANTAKVGITTEQTDAIAANTEKVGVTTEQADAIAANTEKVGLTTEQAGAIAANTEKVGITTEQADAIAANTGKLGLTAEQVDAIAANTGKLGLTTEQADAIAANTEKVGITTEQAQKIAANNSHLVLVDDALVAFDNQLVSIINENNQLWTANDIKMDDVLALVFDLDNALAATVSFPGFGTSAGTALEGNTPIPEPGLNGVKGEDGISSLIKLSDPDFVYEDIVGRSCNVWGEGAGPDVGFTCLGPVTESDMENANTLAVCQAHCSAEQGCNFVKDQAADNPVEVVLEMLGDCACAGYTLCLDANGQGETGYPSATSIVYKRGYGDECPNGGTKVETGQDVNDNGELDALEVDHSALICP